MTIKQHHFGGRVRTLRVRLKVLALAILAAIAIGLLVITWVRRPAETVYTAEVDTYVSTAHPDTNYGSDSTLRADATPRIRAFLRFRLDGLSGRIVRAHLRLWSPTGDLIGYSVHPVMSTNWDERSITSRHHPRAGGPIARSGPFAPASWSTADVTRLIYGRNDVSLALFTTSTQNIAFHSREGSHKPQLVVQTARVSAVPDLGAAGLSRD